jgi:hypothetical protein
VQHIGNDPRNWILDRNFNLNNIGQLIETINERIFAAVHHFNPQPNANTDNGAAPPQPVAQANGGFERFHAALQMLRLPHRQLGAQNEIEEVE